MAKNWENLTETEKIELRNLAKLKAQEEQADWEYGSYVSDKAWFEEFMRKC